MKKPKTLFNKQTEEAFQGLKTLRRWTGKISKKEMIMHAHFLEEAEKILNDPNMEYVSIEEFIKEELPQNTCSSTGSLGNFKHLKRGLKQILEKIARVCIVHNTDL